mgnify:CR=1 FL=1
MSAGRVVALVFGIISVVLGTLAILVAGGATATVATVVSAVGTTGTVTAAAGTVTSGPGDSAIVIDKVKASIDPAPLPESVESALTALNLSPAQIIDQAGDFVLIASPAEGLDVFMGVAAPEAIDGYLFGHPYSVAQETSGAWQIRSVPGAGNPAPPGEQGFWTQQASGSPAVIPATALNGESLVLMRTDGSPGVSVALRLEYRAPQARAAIENAAIAAVAGGLGGLLLVILGAWLIAGRRSSGAHS